MIACGSGASTRTPSLLASSGGSAACPASEVGTTDAARREALVAIRSAPEACREAITALAAAIELDVPSLTAYVAKTVTLDSLAVEVHAKRAAGDLAAADEAAGKLVKLARLESGELTTWIPERANRRPIVSPDAKHWAVALPERVSIHDTATGLEVASHALRTGGDHIALLNDLRIATADFQAVRVFDATGKLEQTLREGKGLGTSLQAAVVASPDGKALAIIDATSIELVSVEPGTLGAKLATADRKPGGNGPWLDWAQWHGPTLMFHDNPRFEIWQVAGAKLEQTAMFTTWYDAIALSWDGSRIALRGKLRDHTRQPIRVLDVKNTTLVEVTGTVFPEAIGFLGTQLYAVESDGRLLRLDGKRFEPVPAKLSLAWPWAEAADRLVMGSAGVLVPAAGGLEVVARIAPGAPIDALAWSPSHELVVAAGGAFTIVSAARARATKGEWRPVTPGDQIGFRKQTAELWWLAGTDDPIPSERSVLVWDTTAVGKAPSSADARTPLAASTLSTVIALTGDGTRYLVLPGNDKDLEVRAVGDGSVVQTIHVRSPFGGGAMDVDRAVFVDGDRLLVLSGNGHTVVWNVALKVSVWTADEPLLAVSADGRSLVTKAVSGIHGWDLSRQRDLGVLKLAAALGFEGDKGSRGAAAFRPDGAQLAVALTSGAIELVDVASWKSVKSIAAHELDIAAVAWRPDGKLLATGSRGGVVKLWDPDGTPRATIAVGTNIQVNRFNDREGSPDPDAWIALLPDGTVRGNAAGRRHLATRIGTRPLGTGLVAPAEASNEAWAALFTSP